MPKAVVLNQITNSSADTKKTIDYKYKITLIAKIMQPLLK